MVDFSHLFVIFEYLKKLEWLNPYLTQDTAWILGGSLAVLFLVLSLVLKPPADAAKINKKVLFRFLALLCAILAGLAALHAYIPGMEAWISGTLHVDPANFIVVVFGAALAAVAVVFVLLRRRQSNIPDNNSALNKRQSYGVFFVAACVLLGFLLLWRFVNPAFNTVILALILFTEIISVAFWFYDPIIYILSRFLVGRRAKPPVPPTPDRINRFAVIACAHNEEKVIGQLIKSVYSTGYPRNRYDLFILCDNCTDGTADIARQAGAIAMERHDPDRRGKGFGLEWMFGILAEKKAAGDAYDAYIVLDADNLVNNQFLDEINTRLNEGYEILQCYLGTKNPGDTWVSKCYALAYCLSDANYQDAHDKVGLSAQMGGTGMVLRPSVLEEMGWETDSLTEDLVLTTRYVLHTNRPCSWVNEARLYDEKPLRIAPSVKQRTRWMQGHMDTMIRYAPACLWQGIRNLSLKQIDIGFYLMRPMLNLIMFVVYFARWMAVLFFPDSVFGFAFFMNDVTATILILAYLLIQLYTLADSSFLRYAFWIPLQWIFTYTWYLPIFRGIIKHREKYWVSTAHERALSIEEVQEDATVTEAQYRLEGLDNLHKLPLGQILLKAAVISRGQLEAALRKQRTEGGYLGDIIVEQQAISPETLGAYLAIQEKMKEAAELSGDDEQRLLLGEILLDAGIITKGQLNTALNYQKEHGGLLGDCFVETRCIPPEFLEIFLEIQKVLNIHYVTPNKAHHLITGLVTNDSPDIEDALLDAGIISRQQQMVAREVLAEQGGDISHVLIDLGYVTPELLASIITVHNLGRHHRKQLDERVGARAP